ncbi:hypothetical protein MPL3356_550002 [Mesorhizobium plurifarium]|uniref:Uncharacterized protein n=1 Tax=Mesorhizobium plurifarium TaxID=69974 RepID=A0A090E6V3_MESPL|nr:hypothetical protein MPL3356_550002 [Mesorhizobium plurifarium]
MRLALIESSYKYRIIGLYTDRFQDKPVRKSLLGNFIRVAIPDIKCTYTKYNPFSLLQGPMAR